MGSLNRIGPYAAVLTLASCGGGSMGSSTPAAGMSEEGTTAAYGASVERDVSRVRGATRAFHSIDAAAAAGYARNVQECIAHPQHGAMGFHHANVTLLDDVLEVERPEMLVYERTADGGYDFTGVEYIVPYAARPRDAAPPEIMGRKLKRADGLGLWYLHVWIWKENGQGLFADWNPAVECR